MLSFLGALFAPFFWLLSFILSVFSGIFLILLFPLVLILFFLPTLLAFNDKHRLPIFALNILGLFTSGITWLAALGWATFFRQPRFIFKARPAKSFSKKDKESFIIDLLKVKDSQNTVQFVQEQTGIPKAEVIRLVSKMVAEKLLVEELDMYKGHWYYYANLDDESAHLNIHQRKKKKV